MGKSAPKTPSVGSVINDQNSANASSAVLQQVQNMTDQNNPYSSLLYTPNGAGGYTATTTLSAPEQQLLGSTQQGQQSYAGSINSLLGNSSGLLSTPVQNNQPLTYSAGDPSQFAGQAQDLTNSVLQRLQPFTQQQTDTLSAQLRNQGLVPGSQAYDTAMLTNNQQINDLELGAVQTGDTEQQQLYDEALQNAQLGNNAVGQNFSQNLQAQAQPLQLASGLLGGNLVNQGSLVNTPQVNLTTTNTGQVAEDNYQNQLQQYGSNLGGLFGLGSTLLGSALNPKTTLGAGLATIF
jgi:hypothetical protein